MNLHKDPQLFKDAVNMAARSIADGGLGINPLFIEKDYWICRSLALMVKGDLNRLTVFKGGTSLSKAYGIGARFSEDIDVAIIKTKEFSGNQQKNLIKQTARNMTVGMEETNTSLSSKGSYYYKAFYAYPQFVESAFPSSIKTGQILIEINSFSNPYPFEAREIQSFLTQFLIQTGNTEMVEDYAMQPFSIQVLDKRRTLTEKMVSLLRCSLANSPERQLSAKIRHFYDLYFLSLDDATNKYLHSDAFLSELKELFIHDQHQFDEPSGWKEKSIEHSPLLTSFEKIWKSLEVVYKRELPGLAYQSIPEATDIKDCFCRILECLR